MVENPNLFAVIPAQVRYDKNISANAKLLFAEITALSNKEGYCFASNNYFEEYLGLSTRSVQNVLKELKECGHIIIKVERDNITNEVVKRMIFPVTNLFPDCGTPPAADCGTPPAADCGTPPAADCGTPPAADCGYNNTSNINNTRNIKEIYKEMFEFFWRVYPKQRAGSKEKAFSAYIRVIKEKRCTVEKLQEAVEKYSQSDEVERGFAKGCAAWLNDDRFNTEYDGGKVF
jgi:hypothetical protein